MNRINNKKISFVFDIPNFNSGLVHRSVEIDRWTGLDTFTDEQCSKMLERGQDQGYLRCSMKFAKETSTTKNRWVIYLWNLRSLKKEPFAVSR